MLKDDSLTRCCSEIRFPSLTCLVNISGKHPVTDLSCCFAVPTNQAGIMLGYAICEMAPELLEVIGLVRATYMTCERAFNTSAAAGAVWAVPEMGLASCCHQLTASALYWITTNTSTTDPTGPSYSLLYHLLTFSIYQTLAFVTIKIQKNNGQCWTFVHTHFYLLW